MARRKSSREPGVARLTPVEAMELRCLTFQVSTAEAALRHITEIRNAQMSAIAKAHGIDLSEGAWHIDADAARIERQKE